MNLYSFPEESKGGFVVEDKVIQLLEEFMKRTEKRFDSMDQRFNFIDQSIDELQNDVRESQKIMKHCLGDLYQQHDKTHLKVLEIDEKVTNLQLELNSLTVKTAWNNSMILKLDKQMKRTEV